jgi:hypothetical protein
MKSDEGFSDMLDKIILIDCLNENVIPFQSSYLEKSKTLEMKVSGVFLIK